MKKLTFFFAAILFTIGCNQNATTKSDSKADADSIKAMDMAWSNSAAAKNADTHMTYYTDDVVVLVPGEPMLKGQKDTRAAMEKMYKMPGFSIKWTPTDAQVSGDMGYTIGTFEMTVNDSTGKQMQDHGKYVTIWRKGADGKWKSSVDMFNSDTH